MKRVPRKWLTQLREEKGMSIVELAYTAKISDPYVRSIESGHRTPRFPVALRIGEALGLAAEETFNKFFINPPEQGVEQSHEVR